jgi:hypothetical protein
MQHGLVRVRRARRALGEETSEGISSLNCVKDTAELPLWLVVVLTVVPALIAGDDAHRALGSRQGHDQE